MLSPQEYGSMREPIIKGSPGPAPDEPPSLTDGQTHSFGPGPIKVNLKGRIEQGADGVYQLPITLGEGLSARVVHIPLEGYDPNGSEPQPLSPFNYWAYRGVAVNVDGGADLSLDEVKLRIKHAVLRHDKSLERMRREVEALENVERVDAARRERIPDSVRLFVWQRDQGKCVKCGSAEKLEFDHIIPVIKGGSNTERNLQLLCERCNRSKGADI
jgi:hypothetical protein